jgi:predicted amidohydrolase
VIRVCGVQLAPEKGRALSNAEQVAGEVHAAVSEGAGLVVFPEAVLTGYVFDSREEAWEAAVEASGPEVAAVAGACAEAGAWAVFGTIERAGDALFNTALVVGPHGLIGRYRKVHTLCLGVDRFTRPGDGPFEVFDLPFGRVGVHICYDGSFPESARTLRLLGAQLLLLPTNWPDLHLKRELVQVRAYENHVAYFAVSRVGTENGVRFEGGSCAADASGRLLLEAGAEPGRYHVEFDLAESDPSRVVVSEGRYELDYLADRRPERYAPMFEPVPEEGKTGGRGSG